MAALEYWLWLSSSGVSPKAKAALLARFGDAETAFFAPPKAFEKLEGVSDKWSLKTVWGVGYKFEVTEN